jgi:hypothetical protein
MRRAQVLALALLLPPGPAWEGQARPVPAAVQRIVVERAADLVRDNYVFSDRAEAVAQELRKNLAAGKYAALLKPDEFLESVNSDMQAAAGDRHLRIGNNPRIVAQLRKGADGGGGPSPEYLRMLFSQNFRLRRIEMLDGNVGYFKLDSFVELELERPALAGAMEFLRRSSAVILDLTDNGGGHAETSRFLTGYFLPDGTVTGESWDRKTGRTATSRIERAPDAGPVFEMPLFILVSERTASAAEGVAYTLQQLKRALVIGRATKGMANPGEQFPLDDRFYITVPTTLIKNAVSGTNWEGTGVAPDIVIGPDKALTKALAEALAALARTDPAEAARLSFLARGYEAELAPREAPEGLLEQCAGEYEGGRRIARGCGGLVFRSGDAARDLTFIGDGVFLAEGRKDYRLKFLLGNGTAMALEVLWYDGTSDRFKKIVPPERREEAHGTRGFLERDQRRGP